jgi:Domain of unknown function (DUF4333)
VTASGVRRATALVGAALAMVLGLAGCGTIATDDSVEEQIKSQLGTDGADCPTDLDGQVGKSIICNATVGDATFDVKVTVTSVQGDTINFDIERVDSPAPAPTAERGADLPTSEVAGATVAQSVLNQLTSGGKKVDEVTCPDLPARVGASTRCTLTTGHDTYGVTVTATAVQGTDVKFDIQVDQAPQ